jgi:hypothetical protein
MADGHLAARQQTDDGTGLSHKDTLLLLLLLLLKQASKVGRFFLDMSAACMDDSGSSRTTIELSCRKSHAFWHDGTWTECETSPSRDLVVGPAT